MTAPARPAVPGADRAAAERETPGLIEALRADPATRVLRVRADALAVDAPDGLGLVSSSQVPAAEAWAFLGRDADGRGLLAAGQADGAQEGFASLREIGAQLPADQLEWAVTAVALMRWLRESSFCPACGAATTVTRAGWARSCPSCGRMHFPRTDPAVIVAVTDADGDRILLGSNAAWPAGRFSCFAGFAEAGESLEDTVVREVAEEAGVIVSGIRYRGSQPWPYPRSLMLGFRAVATDGSARADGEEIAEVRWFTRAQVVAAREGAGEFTLPGTASIAFRLIADWAAERP